MGGLERDVKRTDGGVEERVSEQSKVNREAEKWRVKRLNQKEVTKAYESPERNHIQQCLFLIETVSIGQGAMDKLVYIVSCGIRNAFGHVTLARSPPFHLPLCSSPLSSRFEMLLLTPCRLLTTTASSCQDNGTRDALPVKFSLGTTFRRALDHPQRAQTHNNTTWTFHQCYNTERDSTLLGCVLFTRRPGKFRQHS
jgi:hypothetical protein